MFKIFIQTFAHLIENSAEKKSIQQTYLLFVKKKTATLISIARNICHRCSF